MIYETDSPPYSILLVLDSAPRVGARDELLKREHIRLQLVALDAFERLKKVNLSPGTMIIKASANRSPIAEEQLAGILAANPDGKHVVIEDFTRLITAVEWNDIKRQVVFLLANLPMMFSIRQYNTIQEIGPVNLHHLSVIEAKRRTYLSEKAKKVAKDRDPDDTRNVSEIANAAKTRRAINKAVKLRTEIKKIRQDLPDSLHHNMAELARQLNKRKIPTPSGRGNWQSSTVKRALDRAEEHDRQQEELRDVRASRKAARTQSKPTPNGM